MQGPVSAQLRTRRSNQPGRKSTLEVDRTSTKVMDAKIDPFLKRQLSIARDLADEDFMNLKFLCQSFIPEGRLEDLNSPQQLFTELKHLGQLNSEKTDTLASLLYHVGRSDLRNRLLGIEEPKEILQAFQHWGGLPGKAPCFVGRREECREVLNKLLSGPCRIVTITGPPGFGKSCVAIHVGYELLSYGVCVFYISLRNCTSMSCMANHLLGALGILAGKEPVHQAQYCVCGLKSNTVIILDNVEDMLLPDVRDGFCNFVESIAEAARYVRLLITSRVAVSLDYLVESHELQLKSLDPKEASKILTSARHSKISDHDAETLAKLCGGVPLVLRTTASLLSKAVEPRSLISEFQRSPVTALKSFNLNTLSRDHQLFYCLDICFSRLEPELQSALMSLSVYPMEFTISQAHSILKDLSEINLEMTLLQLMDNSLLQFDRITKSYAVHSVIQVFCIGKAREDEELSSTYKNAKKAFNMHYLNLIQELCRLFMTTECRAAFEKFLFERRNIRQALFDAVDDPELQLLCIDTANKVMPFLTKAYRKDKFLVIYGRYTDCCKHLGDQKRYSDCLTSEAYCILSHCACHLPCHAAVKKFTEADEIQTKLGDEQSVIRAWCLTKLGRCRAQLGDLAKAVATIERAIEMRKTHGSKVFLAAGYKDLAAAYSFNNEHKKANEIRLEKSLPVYEQLLGGHPYTATLMDDMGNSYHALRDYDNAMKYIKMALNMRKSSLGDHQETARSYHDLGKVLAENGQSYDALKAFKDALTIQEKVLGAHQETIRTHREIAQILIKFGREDEAHDQENKANEKNDAADYLQPETGDR